MTARRTRLVIRIVHVALGACLGVVVYAPTAWTDALRLVLGVVVVPAVVLTGLAMWQQGRLRRLLAPRRREPGAPTGSGS